LRIKLSWSWANNGVKHGLTLARVGDIADAGWVATPIQTALCELIPMLATLQNIPGEHVIRAVKVGIELFVALLLAAGTSASRISVGTDAAVVTPGFVLRIG
jgi:hypothetical protein